MKNIPLERQNHFLDDALLEQYIAGFYGYGNYEGKYWLVGMEEGGGSSPQEIAARLQIWQQHGQKELEDVVEFHRDAGLNEYFSEKPKLQKTWARLIRLILAAEGQEINKEALLTFQRTFLGKKNGKNCLLELLPLPSRSTSHWIYNGCTRIDYLHSRDDYRKKVLPERIDQLKTKFANYVSTPKIVVFYSRQYHKEWKLIAPYTFQSVSCAGIEMEVAAEGKTVYAIIQHPAAHGVPNDYYEETGRYLAKILKS